MILGRRGDRMMRAALTLALVGFLGGCVPWPHRYQHTPRIHGVVTEYGRPAAGVTVALAYKRQDACVEPEVHATTDDAGRFSVPGERRTRFYVVALPAHSLEMWRL